MTEQPNALRLADELEMWTLGEPAAAELRRLYLVEQALDRCRVVCDATSEGWRADAERWQAQRDALVDALKLMVEQFTKTPSTFRDSEARVKAHAALRAVSEAVEENT